MKVLTHTAAKLISLNPGLQGHHKRAFVSSCDISAWCTCCLSATLYGKVTPWGPQATSGRGFFFQLKETKPWKVLGQWKGPLHLLYVQETLPAHTKTEEQKQSTGAGTTFVSSFLVLITAFEPQCLHEPGFCFVWIFCYLSGLLIVSSQQVIIKLKFHNFRT